MAKANEENKAGHITHGDVLDDLGFTAEEIRELEIKMTARHVRAARGVLRRRGRGGGRCRRRS
jgi:hypothetical protein